MQISSLPDLEAERARYRGALFDEYLPFHDRFVNDKTFGGFHCSVRPDGELVSDEKRVWYQGRGIWVYSFLYNHLAREPQYLDVAQRCVQLVMRGKPSDAEQLYAKILARDGTPIGPPDPEVYSDLFVAEGLAEFSRATGDSSWWKQARDILLKCVRIYDRADYYPEIGETYLGPGARPFPGARVQGVWMVLLRSTTQMLAMHSDAELQHVSNRCIESLLQQHYNHRFGLINELINHDGTRPANEYEQLVYAGHAVETMWMLMDEALRRGDARLYETAASLFRRHCEVARDRVYGGLFRNLMQVDENRWSLDKTLFPHQEALIGLMMMIGQSRDSWALELYRELSEYTWTKFPMRRLGSPLWQVAGNRQVDSDPGMTRAENYHHPRFLMLNLLAVERMIPADKTC